MSGPGDYPHIPPLPKLQIDIEPVDGKGAMECGFRQPWIDIGGADDDVSGTLMTGDGSPWLILTLEVGGETIYERVDVRSFLEQWVDDARARLVAAKLKGVTHAEG